ncbi:carbohydrate ABC transporter permease [Flexilinea flocculi]|uniref:ABC-type sugar transport system, permease component n=1 Tax=Flexilinea flocculi TaxID=1678840 RepID=A0A0S7BUP5_9CHLR|nr:sugar ABC transporter permease [Flexilinea flocculi]GAP40248.1 ABC-type sugar transport system, permease component [Flexilinea flocculi]
MPVVFLMPTIVVVLLVMIFPLIYGIFISLFDYHIGMKITSDSFVGLENYKALLYDKVLHRAFLNTVLFALLANLGELTFGTLISLTLLKCKKGIADFVRGLCTMPLLVSPIITGFIWKYMFDPSFGLVYWILGFFGIDSSEFPGLGKPTTALLCVAFTHWWQITPFVVLVVTSGLLSIPEERLEAANLDGASGIELFFLIMLPALKNVYYVVLIISGVDTIKVFDLIYALTQGGPANSTLSLSIYSFREAFEVYHMGYAMAVSVFLMITAFIIFGLPFIHANSSQEE